MNSFQWQEYGYKDKAQEAKRRQLEISAHHHKGNSCEQGAEQKKRTAAWSQQANRKDEKQKRKEKKVRKAQWLRTQGKSGVLEIAGRTKRARTENACDPDSDGEWEELAREEKMAKKLRRGDIDQVAFDREFGCDE